MIDLYRNIKILREKNKLSQDELAKKTGYTSRSSIAKIEKGEVDLTRSKIIAFANALNTSPADLMGWTNKDNAIRPALYSIGEIIKEYRNKYHLSIQDFADKAELKREYISMLENGTGIISSIETVNKIASAMDLPVGDLLSATVRFSKENTTPVYESAAGEGRYGDGSAVDEYVMRLEADQVLVRVKGRSMEPTIQDGDYVVVSAQSVIDFPRQIALVKINGDETTLKRVEVKENGLLLIGDNTSEYPPHFYTDKEISGLPVTIEGVVIKLVREIK